MTVKLLTKHHLEILSLKGGCTGSCEYACQNATLLEITCHGSLMIIFLLLKITLILSNNIDPDEILHSVGRGITSDIVCQGTH